MFHIFHKNLKVLEILNIPISKAGHRQIQFTIVSIDLFIICELLPSLLNAIKDCMNIFMEKDLKVFIWIFYFKTVIEKLNTTRIRFTFTRIYVQTKHSIFQ